MFAYYWRTVEDSMANANWLDQPFDDVQTIDRGA